MLIRIAPDWALPESAATPEQIYHNRRDVLRGLVSAGVLASAAPAMAGLAAPAKAASQDPSAHLYPVPRNDRFTVERPPTPEDLVKSYNNFYEFGSHKSISDKAQALPIRPWDIVFDGMVEKEKTVSIDDLLKQMSLEERIYRLRCVEAWSMVVPWSGFPMKDLVAFAAPLSGAKYITTTTFMMPKVASGQRQGWFPWPYTEGLTIEEATNDLSFVVTGLYGKPLPKQNGAPLRIMMPWKYGFKQAKSIVRFTFTDKRPVSFWEELAGNEYGFWANVNPEVPHPRWSQASERDIATRERIPTRLYNGYGEFVSDLYKNMEGERLFM
jgi:sulfoxide reductase catalytic subunit YedY